MKKESFFNEYQCVVLIDFRTTKQFIEHICIVHRSEKMLTKNLRFIVIIGRLIYITFRFHLNHYRQTDGPSNVKWRITTKKISRLSILIAE